MIKTKYVLHYFKISAQYVSENYVGNRNEFPFGTSCLEFMRDDRRLETRDVTMLYTKSLS